MNCEFSRGQIIFLTYNELEQGERVTLENHLKTCHACQQFQQSLSETRRALDHWADTDCPTNLETLHEVIQPELKRNHRLWLPRLSVPHWVSWGAAACLMLVVGLSLFAWIGIDVKWKDSGLTLRFGPQEIPEITEQELSELLQAQRQTTQAEMSKQLRQALAGFSDQLQDHLDGRQQQMNAQLALIYQAVQSQRAQDLRYLREEIQNLAGATEAELLEAQRAFELILASHTGDRR